MRAVTIPSSTVNFLERTLASLEEKASRGDVPPKSARQAAERGLELREKFGRGGTMIGVARARDIKNGRTLSEQTVRRMKAYFDRHEVDKQGKDWDNEERPSNGKIAWLLWGGDSGRSWATSKVESWNREDGKTKTLPRWLPNGEEITELKHLAAVLCIDEKTAAHCVLDSRNPSSVLLREAKAIVRTAVGSIHYGQPIGATIVADGISWRSRVMESVRTPWDGFTLSFMRGTEPVDGYIVAKQYRNREMKVSDFYDGDKGIDNLFDWIRANEPEFHEGEQYLGLWHDAEHDEIVFDVSMRFTDRERAIKIGMANNQQSIYDVVAKDTIDTGGTGDRKALNNGKILGETAYPYIRDDGRRTEELAERRSGSVQVKSDEVSRGQDVDWSVPQLTSFTQRKGIRRVRDSKFWGKPVGTIITRGMIDDRARGPRVPNSPSSPRVSPRDKFEPLAGGRDRTYLTVDASSIDNLGDTEKQEQKDALLSVFDRTLDQLVSNLSSLFERSEASGAREVGSVWYEDGGNMAGTHAIANDMTREQGCGVFAAMSPLREWEDNVAIGKYIMDIVAEDPVIPDLTVRATKSVKGEDGKMRKVTMTAYEWTALEMSNRGMGSPDDIIGLKFSELPIETQALMVRMLSQAGYFTDHPEGHQGEKLGFMGTDKQGRPKWKSVGWSSGDVHTAKALNIARANPEEVDSVINAQLEGMKVRSFYNNLSLGENNEYPDITMDTHAMSAAAGRTYGSQSREKSVFFGGPPRSAPYGFKGLYPIFAEAFRIVAEENGIPPHRMQAILWLQWRHETENMPIITHTTMAG